MQVKLLHHTPLWVAGEAIRTCWASQEKSDWLFVTRCTKCDNNDYEFQHLSDEEQEKLHDDDKTPFITVGDDNIVECQKCGTSHVEMVKEPGTKDCALIERVGNKFKHASTLEHIVYNFEIKGISRAVLQELARHRIASPSVKSTRYTLKELKNDPMVGDETGDVRPWAEKYLVFIDNPQVNGASIEALNKLQYLISLGIPNDEAKYCMPEAYKTELAWTINMRALQNFLHLRTNKAALKEIRDLANAVFESLPEDHKFMLKDSIYEETVTLRAETQIVFDLGGYARLSILNSDDSESVSQLLKLDELISLDGVTMTKTSKGYSLVGKLSSFISIGYAPQ